MLIKNIQWIKIHLTYSCIIEIIKKKKEEVGKWIPLCCTLDAVWIIIIYYKSVKFKSNDIVIIVYEKRF
ncbi:hypothetical protein FWK35_00004750 [Aphis craccivora]|uniref:Uncharacterized protein n=1 Tax=Aphis craccivora TaxID=307492 RepID=A0A6G0ZER1_APHCR|nr:hypothetical protein FWK35_00004750 [Aphis craccivora]